MWGLIPTSASGGGTSSVGDICSANGGKASHLTGTIENGTDGGSGGGGAGSFGVNNNVVGAGGTNGGDGGSVAGYINNGNVWWSTKGGKGQGTTTRYFGESNGTLYSKGGAGAVHMMSSPQTSIRGANTGDGLEGAGGFASGGGGYTTTKLGVDVTPGQQLSVVVGAGGTGKYIVPDSAASGICIIRWSGK